MDGMSTTKKYPMRQNISLLQQKILPLQRNSKRVENGCNPVPDGGIVMKMVPIRQMNCARLEMRGMDLILQAGCRPAGLFITTNGTTSLKVELWQQNGSMWEERGII